MTFDEEKQEELIEAFVQLLTLLEKSSYTVAIASLFHKEIKAKLDGTNAEFTSEFWIKFSSGYKKLLALATKYTALSNENVDSQLEVKRLLALFRMVEPNDLIDALRQTEHHVDLAKKKIDVFVKALVKQVGPAWMLNFVVSDYDQQVTLTSVDRKKTIKLDCYIDVQNLITVTGEASYKDHDFEFEIEPYRFDPLIFPTLLSCFLDLEKKLELRIAMKVDGTRIRIATYLFQLSRRDLAVARAELLAGTETCLYALSGEKLAITKEPIGRLLDSMNTTLFNNGLPTTDKLYFYIKEDEDLIKVQSQGQETKPDPDYKEKVQETEEKKPTETKKEAPKLKKREFTPNEPSLVDKHKATEQKEDKQDQEIESTEHAEIGMEIVPIEPRENQDQDQEQQEEEKGISKDDQLEQEKQSPTSNPKKEKKKAKSKKKEGKGLLNPFPSDTSGAKTSNGLDVLKSFS